MAKTAKAKKEAEKTMEKVKKAMRLDYFTKQKKAQQGRPFLGEKLLNTNYFTRKFI